MTTPPPPPVLRQHRAARVAVAALFLTNGAIFANLLPRYPQIKADLGLSNAEYGLAVASFPCGALMAGLAAGALIRRFRSSRVAVAGTLLTSAGVLLASTYVGAEYGGSIPAILIRTPGTNAAAATVMTGHAAAGEDYVLIGRAGTLTRPFAALLADLEAGLKRLGAYRGTEETSKP